MDVKVKALTLAAAIVAAGVLQMCIQIPALRKQGLNLTFRIRAAGTATAEVFKGMLPVVFALAVMQVNVLIDRILAIRLIEGSGAVSALFYGNRLMQFPLAIFGIAISVAVFPSLREHSVDGDRGRMWKTFNLGIRMLIFIIIPCSIGLIAIGYPLIDLLFNRGAFTQSGDAVSRTYLVLVAYSTGLLFFCFNVLITKTFHSLDNRKFPAWTAGWMVFLNLGLNLLFILGTPLREAGLALSTSITALVNVLILLTYLVRKYGFDNLSGIPSAFIKAAVSSLIMGGGVIAAAGFGDFGLIDWGEGLFGKIMRVLVCTGGGAAVFFGINILLLNSELKECIAIFRKKR